MDAPTDTGKGEAGALKRRLTPLRAAGAEPVSALKPASADVELDDVKLRRFMLLGPCGVGKSTILNMLYNNDATIDHCHPARTSNSSVGVSLFTEYFSLEQRFVLVDSIGFGDNRFTWEEICGMHMHVAHDQALISHQQCN